MEIKVDRSREELDDARCGAQWSTVPALVYRLKRWNANESVLPETAQLEAQFIQLVQQVRSQHYAQQERATEDTIYGQDTPTNVSLPLRLSPTQVTSIENELIKLITTYTKVTPRLSDEWQTQFSKITLSRVYFETGQYRKALDALQNLALRLEDVTTGYGFVLLIQARVIKGICFELTNNEKDALDTFESTWSTIEDHLNETGAALAYWVEDGLYRAIMLSLRTSASVDLTLKFMRAYSQLSSSHWSPHWRIQKRWIVFKLYTDYLIDTYTSGIYKVNLKGQPQITKQQSAFYELFTLMNQCRAIFRVHASKLPSKDPNDCIEECINIMFEAHDIIGWGEICHIRRIQQFLYHVEPLTYNSCCILRSLFYTLLRLGNFDEAKYAFRSYMELVGLPDVDKVDQDCIKVTPQWSVLSAVEKMRGIRSKLKLVDSESDQDNGKAQPRALVGNETVIHVVRVLLAATQLWGCDYNNGKQAVASADLAVTLINIMEDVDISDNNSSTRTDDTLVVECHRTRGVAYGLLASQCNDPEFRSQYQKEALMSLETAATLNPECWKSQYELAFQQLQMREINAAAASIRLSLQLNQSHLPSWHLLSLLYSCQGHENLLESLQTLDLILSETHIADTLVNISTGLPVMSWSGELNCRNVLATADSIIQLHLSRLTCMSKLEGPEIALSQLPDLFRLYSTITSYLGIAETMELDQLSFFTSVKSNTRTSPSTASFSQVTPDHLQQQQRRNSRKSSRSEIKSIITINSPVNLASTSARGHIQQATPPSSLDDLEDTSKSASPSLKNDTKGTTDSSTGTEAAPFVRRRRSGGSLTSFSSNPALIDNIKSHVPSSPVREQMYNGLSLEKTSLVRRSSQSIKKNLHHVESTLSRKNTTLHETAKSGGSSSSNHATPSSQFSLTSILTPSLSMASMRSHSGLSSSYVSALGSVITTSSTQLHAYQKHNNAFLYRQHDRWNALLIKLWLFATTTFIQAGRLEEARKAIVEMETLGAGEADVWHQMGCICIEAIEPLTNNIWTKDQRFLREMALEAFQKALTLEEDHAATLIDMASLFIQLEEWEMAEGLLTKTTYASGWDDARAWFLLGLVYQHQQLERAKECFLYALDLNDTATITPALRILPRFV